jgi:hypothetical protein
MNEERLFYTRDDNGDYRPVSKYDIELTSAMPFGDHLVVKVKPGVTSTRYNINPDLASLLAASIKCEDRLVEKLLEVGTEAMDDFHKGDLGKEVQQKYQEFLDAYGRYNVVLRGASYADMTRAFFAELIDEARNMLKNPAARAAFDEYLLTCKLCGEEPV